MNNVLLQFLTFGLLDFALSETLDGFLWSMATNFIVKMPSGVWLKQSPTALDTDQPPASA